MTEATRETLMSHESIEWTTPPDLYRAICRSLIGKDSCDIDLACTPENKLAPEGMYACQGVRDAYAMPQSTKEEKLARRKAIIHWQKVNAHDALYAIQRFKEPKTFWLNPPYGYELPIFAKLAQDIANIHYPSFDGEDPEPVGHTVLMLVPARIDTKWYCEHVYPCETCFLKGRVKFGGVANSAPFPSMVCRIHDFRGLDEYNWLEMRDGKLSEIEVPSPKATFMRGIKE